MDAATFDRLVASAAGKRSRRDVLKGLLGLAFGGGVAIVAADGADAARRGFAGPHWPGNNPPEVCVPDCGEAFCGIPDGCGGICGCSGHDVCFNNECRPECFVVGTCSD